MSFLIGFYSSVAYGATFPAREGYSCATWAADGTTEGALARREAKRLPYRQIMLYHRRGGVSVKSNMVYNLCKDMVYTFELQFSCVWNPNGA